MASLGQGDISGQNVKKIHSCTEVDTPGGSLFEVWSFLERAFEAHLSVAAQFWVALTFCTALDFFLDALTSRLIYIILL